MGTGILEVLWSGALEKYHWYCWLTPKEIADIYDVDESSICKWMSDWNIYRWDNHNFLTFGGFSRKLYRDMNWLEQAFQKDHVDIDRTVYCVWCDKTIERSLSELKRSEFHYCSRRCAMSHRHAVSIVKVPYRWNQLEQRVYKWLVKLFGLRFFPHVRVKGYGVADFYCPEFRIIVEINGDYWHTRQPSIDRDRNKRFAAEACGYQLVELWESDIKDMLSE